MQQRGSGYKKNHFSNSMIKFGFNYAGIKTIVKKIPPVTAGPLLFMFT